MKFRRWITTPNLTLLKNLMLQNAARNIKIVHAVVVRIINVVKIVRKNMPLKFSRKIAAQRKKRIRIIARNRSVSSSVEPRSIHQIF